MKFAKSLILLVALLSPVTTVLAVEDSADAAESVETLQFQLLEVQSKEADLEARAKQLDEDLKPENIERSLAGIGSTKPEELRDLRRRQLTIERDSLRGQLKLLATSRERLESVIRLAETQAYQQSMLNQTLAGKQSWSFGWVVGIAAVVGGILGIATLVVLTMKRARRA